MWQSAQLTPLPGDSHTFTREWDRRLGEMYDEAEARFGVPWHVLAGIGRVETRHGTFGGTRPGPDGVPLKPIIGIPLGIASFKMAGAALTPFGKIVVPASQATGNVVAAVPSLGRR